MKKIVLELLRKDRVSVLCNLGKEKGAVVHERRDYRHYEAQSHIAIKQPYPYEYYTAYRWLESKRKQLQKKIAVDFGYLSKKEMYPRGKELDLILDISKVIEDVVGDDVDPVLVTTVLFKEGLDALCLDYTDVTHYVKDAIKKYREGEDTDTILEILDEALKIAPNNSDANYTYGSTLLITGRWKEAVPFFEKAIEHNPANYRALNDLAYVLTEFEGDPKRGFEYAKQSLSMVWRGSSEECPILDTVGWAYYQQETDLTKAKKYLTEALNLTHPESGHYIPVCYHLLVVLKDTGDLQGAKDFFAKILRSTPKDAVGKELYKRAKEIMQEI